MNNKWSLVVLDVDTDTAKIWVGTLFPNEKKYEKYSVTLKAAGQEVDTIEISKDEFERPFQSLNQRFFKRVTFDSLSPSTKYEVVFSRAEQMVEGHLLDFKILSSGSFTTLPSSLGEATNPFVVALGSCYYGEEDGGRVSDAYSALCLSDNQTIQPDVKFLTGDQVYLDIGLDSLSPIEDEIKNRIADDYAIAWQSLRPMLRHGGTWMLSDDHEYWNNYPNTSGFMNPYLWMISASDRVKRWWKSTAKDGIERIQNVQPVSIFKIGDELSFCLADVRSNRTESQFMGDDDFDKVIDWATNLECPGVLTLAQPVMVKKGNDQDKNLVNYTDQYNALLKALASSGNDIMLLSGDVHFGRIGSVEIGNNGTTLHEVISSPLSNLTGLDGKIASNRAKKLKTFPAVTVPDIPAREVSYPSSWYVSAQKVKSWFFPTNHTKTKEHFFTLSFSKKGAEKVQVDVQAWKVRERDRKGLPRKQFKKAHRIILERSN